MKKMVSIFFLTFFLYFTAVLRQKKDTWEAYIEKIGKIIQFFSLKLPPKNIVRNMTLEYYKKKDLLIL